MFLFLRSLGQGAKHALRHIVFEFGNIFVAISKNVRLVSRIFGLLQADRFLAEHELVFSDFLDLLALVKRRQFVVVFNKGNPEVCLCRFLHQNGLSDVFWTQSPLHFAFDRQRDSLHVVSNLLVWDSGLPGAIA